MTTTARDSVGLRREVAAMVEDERAAGSFIPRCDAWMRGVDREFSRKLGAHGWLGINWPERYGGGGGSHLDRLVITEELLRSGAPVAAHWVAERQIGPAILRYGSEQLKSEFLPPTARGELCFCLGMSETESGSDLAAVRTSAKRDGTDYVVAGSKVWTTNAHVAEFAYVLAVTDTAAGKDRRLSELIVDMSSPGVEVRPIHDLAGEHHFNEMIFDDVRVPAERVIGEEGAGWKQVTEQLAFERGGPERFLSTYPLLEQLAALYGGEPSAAARLGALIGRLRGLRALAMKIAGRMDAGQAPIAAAATLKLLGTRFEQDVIETGRALVEAEPDPGAAGIAATLTEAQLAAPGISLRGGASEILAGIVARAVSA